MRNAGEFRNPTSYLLTRPRIGQSGSWPLARRANDYDPVGRPADGHNGPAVQRLLTCATRPARGYKSRPVSRQLYDQGRTPGTNADGPTPSARAKRGQSNAAPGSVLRGADTSLWPRTARSGYAVNNARASGASTSYCASV